MKVRQYLLIFSLIFTSIRCVDPISLQIKSETPKLVINGVINNQDDSCVVRIAYTNNYSADYRNVKDLFEAVAAKKVTIKDNKGNVADLYEHNKGVYVTKSLKGVIGNTYTLYIEMPNGKKYQSYSEKLTEVPPIDSINYNVIPESRFFNGIYFQDLSLKLNAYFQDPVTEKNYYKWKWVGESVFRIKTTPTPTPNSDVPLFCYYKLYPTIKDSFEDELNILSDQNINGTATYHPSLFFHFDAFDFRFSSSISLLMAQYSLTQRAYQYWDKIKKLTDSQGSIFDPAPFQIIGNIYNVDDPTENVFGYFGASGVNYFRYQFFVIHYKVESCVPIDASEFCEDCRKYRFDYALTPPLYWIR